jgi:hypothetical protein
MRAKYVLSLVLLSDSGVFKVENCQETVSLSNELCRYGFTSYLTLNLATSELDTVRTH